MPFATWSRLATEGNEAGIVVFDGLDALSQNLQLVEFGGTLACYGGDAGEVFLTDHLSTACRIVSSDDLDAQFAQVLVRLGQSLGVRDDAPDIRELLPR